MKKKNVLFVIHQLNHGGSQKALLSALDAIDYSENNVSLYIRKNRTDLISEVNSHVSEIIVNDDKTSYYRKPHAVILQLMIIVTKIFGLKDKNKLLSEKLQCFMIDEPMRYEKKKYFSKSHYDIAVSYIHGHHSKLVSDYIDADYKIMFYHESEDVYHELHEKAFVKYDKIVAVSEKVKDMLCAAYPESMNKIIFINNCVSAEKIIAGSTKEKVETPKGKIILCSCGRMSEVKGYDIAVKAGLILKDKGYDFLWYFVGDGPERESTEKLIKEKGVIDYFALVGMKDNPYPWMAACDVFVQPSYAEAYGLTINEAQILHKPVVTTATVGGKMLVKNGETGVITATTPEDLSNGIEKIIKDSVLRDRIKDKLSLICFHDLEELYRKEYAELLG